MRRKSFALEGSLAEGEPEGPARGRARRVDLKRIFISSVQKEFANERKLLKRGEDFDK